MCGRPQPLQPLQDLAALGILFLILWHQAGSPIARFVVATPTIKRQTRSTFSLFLSYVTSCRTSTPHYSARNKNYRSLFFGLLGCPSFVTFKWVSMTGYAQLILRINNAKVIAISWTWLQKIFRLAMDCKMELLRSQHANVNTFRWNYI